LRPFEPHVAVRRATWHVAEIASTHPETLSRRAFKSVSASRHATVKI